MTIAIPKQSSLPEMPQESTEQESVEAQSSNLKLPNIEEIIINHEHRIQSLEAALMRIRGAI